MEEDKDNTQEKYDKNIKEVDRLDLAKYDYKKSRTIRNVGK